MTDDGAGIRVAQRLAEGYEFPPEVTVMDGGTLGLDLLVHLEGVDRLLIIDAVETGGPAGTIVRMTDEEIPTAFESKLSSHQMGLKDLLAVSVLCGITPPEMVLLGVQPGSIELGTDLTPEVEAQLDTLVDKALLELDKWGVRVKPVRR